MASNRIVQIEVSFPPETPATVVRNFKQWLHEQAEEHLGMTRHATSSVIRLEEIRQPRGTNGC